MDQTVGDVPYPNDSHLKALQEELKETEDTIVKKTIEKEIEVEQRAFDDQTRRYNMRTALFAKHIQWLQDQPPNIDLDFPDLLPLHHLVQKDKQLQHRILTVPKLLQLVIALCGGYHDFKSSDLLEEQRRLQYYAQLANWDREPFDIMYSFSWGEEKQVFHKMKAHMTTQWKYLLADIKPRFQFSAMYHDSHLTPCIIQVCT